ncbi:MAG: hypothetical protein ACK53Y_19370, partial [bacterium]
MSWLVLWVGLGTFRLQNSGYMAVVTYLLVLARKIGIFFGLAAFEFPCSLAVVVVAVSFFVLNILLDRRRLL